jgi:antitoxin VapB
MMQSKNYIMNVSIGVKVSTAKLFRIGRRQIVRLPNNCRIEGNEVIVKKIGAGVLLLPINDPWSCMLAALEMFEPGFRLEREQPST